MKGFSIEQLDFLYDNDVPTLKFKGYHFDSEMGVAPGSDTASAPDSEMRAKDAVVTTTKAYDGETK